MGGLRPKVEEAAVEAEVSGEAGEVAVPQVRGPPVQQAVQLSVLNSTSCLGASRGLQRDPTWAARGQPHSHKYWYLSNCTSPIAGGGGGGCGVSAKN